LPRRWPPPNPRPGAPAACRPPTALFVPAPTAGPSSTTGAPDAVKRAIAAANQIDGRPYIWGGGHVSFLSRGYDCSGAVSYVLHAAGLLDQTMVSGQLAYWGGGGIGRWITVYANNEHVFMVIAGLRFDTREDPPGVNGPRWHRARVEPSGFAARHPTGL
jgi:hypothetical protein